MPEVRKDPEYIKQVIRLYLVTDRAVMHPSHNGDLPAAVEKAIQGGVTMVQLREKDLNTQEYIKHAKELKKVTDAYNIPLIINDRVDVAEAVGASGVHLGGGDMEISDARRVLGNGAIIGATCRTPEDADRAYREGADYIGCAALYPTSTKKDAVPIGMDGARAIVSHTPLPCTCIGGINLKNYREVVDNVAPQGLAVVSAILGETDPTKTASRMKWWM
eukprot:Nk52_evm2s2116 gene=Nk52_evmTU2s2116